MNLEQYLLAKLAEESAEIAKIALKAQQFGFYETKSGQLYTNTERTHQELDDLMAIVEMLNDLGFNYEPNQERIEAKKKKVIRYLRYSVDLKMVDSLALAEYNKD